MKHLILFRHGHAVANTEEADDIKRELTPSGEQHVISAVKQLEKNAFIPQKIFSSPATRTMQTAEIIVKTFANAALHVEIQPTLYSATVADLLIFIETLPPDCQRVLLVGHNPGLSECASLLAKQELPHLAPGSSCWLQWEGNDSWENIANGIALGVKIG